MDTAQDVCGSLILTYRSIKPTQIGLFVLMEDAKSPPPKRGCGKANTPRQRPNPKNQLDQRFLNVTQTKKECVLSIFYPHL